MSTLQSTSPITPVSMHSYTVDFKSRWCIMVMSRLTTKYEAHTAVATQTRPATEHHNCSERMHSSHRSNG